MRRESNLVFYAQSTISVIRATERQTDRHRQTDRQTGRHTDTDRHRHRQRQRQRDRQRERAYCPSINQSIHVVIAAATLTVKGDNLQRVVVASVGERTADGCGTDYGTVTCNRGTEL